MTARGATKPRKEGGADVNTNWARSKELSNAGGPGTQTRRGKRVCGEGDMDIKIQNWCIRSRLCRWGRGSMGEQSRSVQEV